MPVMPNTCKATVNMAEDPGLDIRSPGTRPGSQQLEAELRTAASTKANPLVPRLVADRQVR